MKKINLIKAIAFILTWALVVQIPKLTNIQQPETSVDVDSSAEYNVNKGKEVYALKSSRTYGYVRSWDSFPAEGYAGMKVDCNKNTVNWSYYKHNSKTTITGTKFFIMDTDLWDWVDYKIIDTKNYTFDKTYNTTLDKDGIYKMVVCFDYDNKVHDIKVIAELCVKNGVVNTCYYSDKTCAEDYEKWNKLMSTADPKDYVDETYLCYPTKYGYHCVKEYQQLAEELIGEHDSWSDQFKVFVFAQYIAENYAYDNWRRDNNMSRATANNDWNTPDNFIYESHCGVCVDFTNVMCIMCRHYGIPCTSVDKVKHTANAVYINGEWLFIDLTGIVYKHCGEDMTDFQGDNPKSWYGSYMWYSDSFDSYDGEILYSNVEFKQHDERKLKR